MKTSLSLVRVWRAVRWLFADAVVRRRTIALRTNLHAALGEDLFTRHGVCRQRLPVAKSLFLTDEGYPCTLKAGYVESHICQKRQIWAPVIRYGTGREKDGLERAAP